MGSCKMPPDFDDQHLDALHGVLASHNPRPEWNGASSACNGIAYRFRAAAEADDLFTQSITASRHGDAEERYKQESGLFSFFVNAASAIESFFFMSYWVGAMLKPGSFPASVARDLRLYPKDILARYKRAYSGDAFVAVLDTCYSSREYAVLSEYRDAFIHRGALPRHHECESVNGVVDLSKPKKITIPVNPKEVPRLWQSTVEVNAGTTRAHRQWLARQLSDLLVGGHGFCSTQFVRKAG